MGRLNVRCWKIRTDRNMSSIDEFSIKCLRNGTIKACNLPFFAVFLGLTLEGFHELGFQLQYGCQFSAVFYAMQGDNHQRCSFFCSPQRRVNCYRRNHSWGKPGFGSLQKSEWSAWVSPSASRARWCWASHFSDQTLKDWWNCRNVGLYTAPKILMRNPHSIPKSTQ